jgi:hypothetical protein
VEARRARVASRWASERQTATTSSSRQASSVRSGRSIPPWVVDVTAGAVASRPHC